MKLRFHIWIRVSFIIFFYAETIFKSKAKYIFTYFMFSILKRTGSKRVLLSQVHPINQLDNQLLVHLVNTQLQHKLNYKPLPHSISYSSIFSKLSLLLYEYVEAPVSHKNYLYGGLKLECRRWKRGGKGKTLWRKHMSPYLPITNLTPGTQKTAATCKLELLKTTREVYSELKI